MADQSDSRGAAFGAPGLPPKWTSSSKDGVGTAYSTASSVWFTISHGILNEIYYPTIDRPQVRDMQFLVTNGAGLFHEERRDLLSEVRCIEPHVLGHHIENADPAGRYRIVKEIIADPHQACVLVNARLEGDPELVRTLQVYALLAPHLEVGGWGNSARVVELGGTKILVAWKGGTWLAMGADAGFVRASCGYVAASDGWQDLHDNCRMDWEFDEALNGNVAVIGEIDLERSASSGVRGPVSDVDRGPRTSDPGPQRQFTIGIAFGDSMHAAIAKLAQSLAIPFPTHRSRFVEQWHRAAVRLPLEGASQDQGLMYSISRNLLLAHEDKTFAGALIASASIPWGNAKGDEDLGGYHLVWTRDLVQSATALLASGEVHTPLRALVYLACTQGQDGGFAQNFWIDGTPYWNGVQLDEVAFPVTLAWRLWKADALQQFDPYPMVVAAAGFLVRQGPASQQERWEECAGYSPSTLAITIAALVCAADFAASHRDAGLAAFLLDYADFLESHVERWTVTTRGTLVPGIARHYVRVTPVAPDGASGGDPNEGSVILNNQPPGSPWQYRASTIVDAGFLELVRYGIRSPGDPLAEDSLRVVDAVLKVETPSGPCWRRYNHDGYGTRPDGGPYEGWGQGRAWPLLVGERAHYELACGRNAGDLVGAMERFASKGGMLPEQVWDAPDLPVAGMYAGRPAGSAMPLMWAHAEYVKLLRSIHDGRVFDLIEPVAARYREGKGRRDLEVWKLNHQVRAVSPGQVLRVQAPAAFELDYSLDGGKTTGHTFSTPTTIGVGFVDVAVPRDQREAIRFTLRGSDGADGREFEVGVAR